MARGTPSDSAAAAGKKGDVAGAGGEGERPPSPPPTPVFKDVRRYYCEFCGICRSKKYLIASHVRSHHQDKVGDSGSETEEEGKRRAPPRYTCEECGASFRKPAYLRQHMQGHSVEVQGFLMRKIVKKPLLCGVKHWIPYKELQLA